MNTGDLDMKDGYNMTNGNMEKATLYFEDGMGIPRSMDIRVVAHGTRKVTGGRVIDLARYNSNVNDDSRWLVLTDDNKMTHLEFQNEVVSKIDSIISLDDEFDFLELGERSSVELIYDSFV